MDLPQRIIFAWAVATVAWHAWRVIQHARKTPPLVALLALVMATAARADEARLPPRIPLTAVELALGDKQKLPPAIAAQRFYVWCPAASRAEVAVAKLVLNIAVSRSPVDYNPEPVAGGALVPVDLLSLAPSSKDFAEVLAVWKSLSDSEPYFHAKVFREENVLVDCEPYTERGETYKKRWDKIKKSFTIPAPHLGAAGVELEKSVGNLTPNRQSFCPIVRVDWFAYTALSSIDGAKYFEFRGLTPGKTKLEEYLQLRGVDERLIKQHNADERAALVSLVSGRGRGINVEQGQLTRPSVGAALCWITDDNFEAETDAKKDPFLSLLDHKADAHEVIVTLPSGWPEYTIFNGQGLLVGEVPPNVAQDATVPSPFHGRINGAISCLRCHGPQDGFRGFRNEAKDTLADRGRLLADISGRANQLDNLTRVASLYSGDLSRVVKSSRDAFDRRCFALTGAGAKHLCNALARAVGGYQYEFVGPKKACEELGFAVPAEDKTGAITFRRVVPAKSLAGDVADDGLIARLHTDYLDEDSGQRVPLTLTRQQWELIYADAMDRALAQQRPAAANHENTKDAKHEKDDLHD